MKRRRSRRRIDPNTLVLLRQIGWGLLTFTIVGLLIAGAWYGSRVDALTITQISVSGGETIDHATVRELVEAELTGTYLGLIPRRFAWTYPEQDILTTLLSVERLHSPEVTRSNGRTLQVRFVEYEPFALWCTDLAGGECWFLDQTGYAFADAPPLSGGSFLRLVRLDEVPSTTKRVASTTHFARVVELTDELAQIGWSISHVELDQVGDVYLQVVGGSELKATLSEPPASTVDNFTAILGSDEFSHLAPGNFQYVDLRFGNKVFVNEELPAVPEIGTSTATSTQATTTILELAE
ncbi:MAG: cell division protein FtsQ/DivIB [Patescibacteria group bacterium]